jgi:hypothetical protein
MDAFKLVAGQVPNGLIVEAMLGTGSVTEPKLGALSVTHAKLGLLAVENENIAGSITMAKLAKTLTDGTDVTLGAAITERTTTSTSYTKLKEIQILQSGTVTVTWAAKAIDGGGKSKMCINDAAVGSEKWTAADGSYTTQTQTGVVVDAGDLIQIYAKKVTTNCFVKDMYVKSAGFMTDIIIN